MMTNIFGKKYADQYDLLYGDKNYEAECDLLEDIFRRFSEHKVHKILDLGCGTGNHVIPLALRGYDVTGVDMAAEMLTRAREKLSFLYQNKATNLIEPVFYVNDLCQFEIDQKFDAVLMMFAVLGYQEENSQVTQALNTVSKHLRPGGVLVFDVWYGPAVLAIRPSDRVKVIPVTDGQLIRAASGSLDTFRQLAEVNYRLWHIQNNRVINETGEFHRMRYFFPQELILFLQQAGMNLESLTAFPSLDQPASEESWNVLGVSRIR